MRWALFAVALATWAAGAQTAPNADVKKVSAHRAHEMTLAGLRPGRDSIARAAEVNKYFRIGRDLQGSEKTWLDGSMHL
jgi:hypothetical protein